ncbi:hypothetical protein Q7C36_015090 [Tachysurus vachellii]|uniref:Uncharacterized protein n=2 Tax=Tachysurus vachellii TaxID=175792 RepID=A0AA88SEQ8_TACVA|nr:hypothetical protein Q7C36_015090 [Tachysurus vachellii]
MPSVQDDSDTIPQSMMEALELFCTLPEQSYEQFLSTFMPLSTENVIAGLKFPEEESKTCLVELNGVKLDKKVDIEEETEDINNMEVCVLPGEVEEDSPAYTPAFCHHTQLELSSTDMDHMTHTALSNTESQTESEEVVPFSLDDTFDYDNVTLSHKYPVKSSNCGSS